MRIHIEYQDGAHAASHGPVSKEFESAWAAFQHNDPNPIRQYLGLPLKHPCEDCDTEEMLIGHGKSLVCLACAAERDAFLEDVYDAQWKAREDEDSVYEREKDRRMFNGEC